MSAPNYIDKLTNWIFKNGADLTWEEKGWEGGEELASRRWRTPQAPLWKRAAPQQTCQFPSAKPPCEISQWIYRGSEELGRGIEIILNKKNFLAVQFTHYFAYNQSSSIFKNVHHLKFKALFMKRHLFFYGSPVQCLASEEELIKRVTLKCVGKRWFLFLRAKLIIFRFLNVLHVNLPEWFLTIIRLEL